MTIEIYGRIKNNAIHSTDAIYSHLYDPDGLLDKYNNKDSLVVLTIKVFVSKSGKFVPLVDKIEEA